MEKTKNVEKMSFKELVAALQGVNEEHDIDCEEGGPNDRCPAHLSEELLKRTKKLEEAMSRIGGPPGEDEEWDLEELSENLEPGDMVRAIYYIGVALR